MYDRGYTDSWILHNRGKNKGEKYKQEVGSISNRIVGLGRWYISFWDNYFQVLNGLKMWIRHYKIEENEEHTEAGSWLNNLKSLF